MPKLLVEAKKNLGRTEITRILVATSGDTGKAALAGYADLDGIEIEVFYPNAGTSEIQHLQMATQKGENVQVYAVEGNFDDAQTGVKRVFADDTVAAELEARHIRLSSANSINWGRLVPQIVYYFYAYFRLAEQGAVAWGSPVDFCVPTGNFGDILAGYYAKQMGLPVGKLICASNKNNVLTDFIKTGTYDARRTFYKTTSPSMDILISSNLERLLLHTSGSAEKVEGWMQELAATGKYTVDADTLAKIQANFAAGYADDAAGAAEIRARFERDGYLCDTHTAVAFHVAEANRSTAPMVVLSTASPFKFPRDVLAALGETAPESDFAAMAALGLFGYFGLLGCVISVDGRRTAFGHCNGINGGFDLGHLFHSRGHFGNNDTARHQRLQGVFPGFAVDGLLLGLDLAALAQAFLPQRQRAGERKIDVRVIALRIIDRQIADF